MVLLNPQAQSVLFIKNVFLKMKLLACDFNMCFYFNPNPNPLVVATAAWVQSLLTYWI